MYNNIYSPQSSQQKRNIYGFNIKSVNPDFVIELDDVRVATTADLGGTFTTPGTISIAGSPASIDGTALALFDRVLVKDQTTALQNGVYQVVDISGPTILVRVADFQPTTYSTIVHITSGTDNADTLWYNVRNLETILGVTSITFIPMTGGGGGTGDVTGVAPTVIGNLAMWDDTTANTISDSGLSVADILAALNSITVVTLSGTAYTTILTELEGTYFISVKNVVTNGPSANFSITKSEPTVTPVINTLSQNPGVGSGELLELRRSASSNLELHKTDVNYDGDYTVTIYGNGVIPGGGDVTDAANLGAGQGLFTTKSGGILQFKSITAGSNITLTPSGTELQIAASGGGSVTNGNNVGGFAEVFKVLTGTVLDFRTIQATGLMSVTQNTNDLLITTTAEANTASNLGAGTGVYATKVGSDLQFKSLVQGSNMTISSTGTEITLTGPTPGEVNTASNLGAGQGLFVSKVGSDLQFKSITAGTNITLTPSGTELQISASGGGGGSSKISYQLSSIPVVVTGSTVSYTKVAYFAWDHSQYSGYTSGKLIIYTIKSGARNYQIDFLGDSTTTLIAGPITVSATGVLNIPLTGIPSGDGNLYIQVRRVAGGSAPNSILVNATLEFTT